MASVSHRTSFLQPLAIFQTRFPSAHHFVSVTNKHGETYKCRSKKAHQKQCVVSDAKGMRCVFGVETDNKTTRTVVQKKRFGPREFCSPIFFNSAESPSICLDAMRKISDHVESRSSGPPEKRPIRRRCVCENRQRLSRGCGGGAVRGYGAYSR